MKRFFSFLVIGFVLFLVPVMSYAANLNITWNSNTEPDLKGYFVCLADKSGGPYIQIGNVEVSPTPTYLYITPPGSEKMFYFVVAAYDKVGNVSGFSNEASVYVDEVFPGTPKGVTITVIITISPH